MLGAVRPDVFCDVADAFPARCQDGETACQGLNRLQRGNAGRRDQHRAGNLARRGERRIVKAADHQRVHPAPAGVIGEPHHLWQRQRLIRSVFDMSHRAG